MKSTPVTSTRQQLFIVIAQHWRRFNQFGCDKIESLSDNPLPIHCVLVS